MNLNINIKPEEVFFYVVVICCIILIFVFNPATAIGITTGFILALGKDKIIKNIKFPEEKKHV